MTGSKSSPGSKQRKPIGKAISQQEKGPSTANVPGHPGAAATGASDTFVPTRLPRPSLTLQYRLKRLYWNSKCVMGMEMLNTTEAVIVTVLMLALAALTALGAYKQIAKLVVGLMAAA